MKIFAQRFRTYPWPSGTYGGIVHGRGVALDVYLRGPWRRFRCKTWALVLGPVTFIARTWRLDDGD